MPTPKGKKLSAEHRKAIGDAVRGKPKHAGFGALISAAKKGKPLSDEHRAKIKESWKYRKLQKRSETATELLAENKLQLLGLEYEKQVKIGSFTVDFLVKPDRVIEAFGCYWHGCEICGSDTIHGVDAKERREYDMKRIKEIEAMGYHVEIWWHHELSA